VLGRSSSATPPKVAHLCNPPNRPSLESSYYPRPTPQPSPCHISVQAPNGTSSRRCCSKPAQHPYGIFHPAHATRLLIELLDTNHVQIHSPEAHGIQDKEAPKIRREESVQAYRHDSCVITAAAIPRPRRSDCYIHTQDIRPRIRNMSTI
jgi:hypothetical protein